MTKEANGSQEPNPYNSKAVPQDVQRGILSADDGLAPPREPKVVEEASQAEIKAESVPDVPVEDPTKPFNKVDYKKRYDDLKRHYDSKLNEFKVKESKMSQQIKDGLPKYTPPRTPDELATFKEEFPEVFATIETIAHSKSSEQSQELQERLDAIEEREATITKREAFSELAKLQPDFEEIKSTQEFHEWVDNQPQDIQDWLYSSFNANLASRAIDLFKRDVGWKAKAKEPIKEKKAPKPKKQPSAADAVGISNKSEPITKEGKVWTTSEINDVVRHNPLEAEKLMSEWDKAFAEGRIVNG